MLLFAFSFLMSSFDVRRYGCTCLICAYCPPSKEINQFLAHTDVLKFYLALQEKDYLNQKSVLVLGEYHPSF